MARTRLYPPSVDPGFPELPPTPEGWEHTTFRNVVEVIERPTRLDPDTKYRLLTAKRNRGGITLRSELLGREILTKTQFETRGGDFLISRRQIIHGACGVVPDELDGAVVSNEYSTLRTRSALSMEFLRHYSHTPYFQRTCFHSSHGVDVEKMIFKLDEWLAREVDVPPLAEQKKIAVILSSVGEAIEATQAVIDQLQVVKKAMMTELLTKGLPGRHARYKETAIGEVPEEWHVVSLGDLIKKGPDNGLYKPQSDYGTGTPIVRIDAFDNGDLLTCQGLRLVRVSDDEVARFRLNKDDILINRVNSLSHLAKTSLVAEPPQDTVFESNMMRLAVDVGRACPSFIFRVLASPASKEFFLSRAKQAVAQASVNQQDVRAVPLPLPSLREQEEIAGLFDSVDDRIEAERRKVDGILAAKAALMSVLLTGEVRVKPDEEVA